MRVRRGVSVENIADNRLVTLDWNEIKGGYNTADTTVDIGPRKQVMK